MQHNTLITVTAKRKLALVEANGVQRIIKAFLRQDYSTSRLFGDHTQITVLCDDKYRRSGRKFPNYKLLVIISSPTKTLDDITVSIVTAENVCIFSDLLFTESVRK